MQFLVKTIAVLTALALAAGFGGSLHPIGDSFSVFRIELTVIFAVALIWTNWPKSVRWLLAVLAILLLGWHVLQSRGAAPQQRDLTVYQQNLLFNRTDGGAQIIALIRQTAPDIIAFQEVSDLNRPILDILRQDYPSQQDCPLDANLGEAVLSRYPVVPGTGFCSARDGLAGLQVNTPNGPVWAVSVHLSWPWPHKQAEHVDQILPDLGRVSGPAVVAGDFNAVAWSHTVARMGAASGTVRQGPYSATFHLPVSALPIGIDHVLTSPDFAATVQRTPKAGADHYGTLTFLQWRQDG